MRGLLPTRKSGGDVEPPLERVARSLGLGAQVSTSPDFAKLLPAVGVPLLPTGASL